MRGWSVRLDSQELLKEESPVLWGDSGFPLSPSFLRGWILFSVNLLKKSLNGSICRRTVRGTLFFRSCDSNLPQIVLPFVIPAKREKLRGNAINRNVPDLDSRSHGDDGKRNCVETRIPQNPFETIHPILSPFAPYFCKRLGDSGISSECFPVSILIGSFPVEDLISFRNPLFLVRFLAFAWDRSDGWNFVHQNPSSPGKKAKKELKAQGIVLHDKETGFQETKSG
jgi:hypothetical protein